jgi:hypothetical protein
LLRAGAVERLGCHLTVRCKRAEHVPGEQRHEDRTAGARRSAAFAGTGPEFLFAGLLVGIAWRRALMLGLGSSVFVATALIGDAAGENAVLHR